MQLCDCVLSIFETAHNIEGHYICNIIVIIHDDSINHMTNICTQHKNMFVILCTMSAISTRVLFMHKLYSKGKC